MSDAVALTLALFGFAGLAVALMLLASILALAIGAPVVLLWRIVRRAAPVFMARLDWLFDGGWD